MKVVLSVSGFMYAHLRFLVGRSCGAGKEAVGIARAIGLWFFRAVHYIHMPWHFLNKWC